MEQSLVMPVFSCNGQGLPLCEIMKEKCVTSVTIKHLSRKQKVKARGIKGLFGKTEMAQVEKKFTVTDYNGITINFKEDSSALIKFRDEHEWEKVIDYDLESLRKAYDVASPQPFSFSFYLSNLVELSWV